MYLEIVLTPIYTSPPTNSCGNSVLPEMLERASIISLLGPSTSTKVWDIPASCRMESALLEELELLEPNNLGLTPIGRGVRS